MRMQMVVYVYVRMRVTLRDAIRTFVFAYKMEEQNTTGKPRPRPRKIFVILVSLCILSAAILIPLGLTAFTFTPNYRVGAFWTGLAMLTIGVYNITWLCIRMFRGSNRCIIRHKRKLGAISSTLSIVCFMICLTGAILDVMAAHLLGSTDFTACSYTNVATTVSCASSVCPSLEVRARTCYCCHLYEERTENGCDSPLLLAKQTYFSGVDSCDALSSILYPMLSAMGGLSLAAAIISMVYVFQSNPVSYQDAEQVNSTQNEVKQRTATSSTCTVFGRLIRRIGNRITGRTNQNRNNVAGKHATEDANNESDELSTP